VRGRHYGHYQQERGACLDLEEPEEPPAEGVAPLLLELAVARIFTIVG